MMIVMTQRSKNALIILLLILIISHTGKANENNKIVTIGYSVSIIQYLCIFYINKYLCNGDKRVSRPLVIYR